MKNIIPLNNSLKASNKHIEQKKVGKVIRFSFVYPYKYDRVPCMETKTSYIGPTTTSKEHIKQHTVFKFHHNAVHKENITGKHMLDNVTVIK